VAANITQDLFARFDPLAWDEEKQAELAEKHGIRAHWCNTKWRDHRRGWGTLDPIEVTDPRFDDVRACLKNKPRNAARNKRNGYYEQGDMTLSYQTVDDWEISQLRRTYLSQRRLKALKDGNPVQEALMSESHTRGIEVPDPVIKHTDSHGVDLLEAAARELAERKGMGTPAKGFTVPDSGKTVPVIRSGKSGSRRKP
jgi:hypothetical protein